jgi:hypothetical protein
MYSQHQQALHLAMPFRILGVGLAVTLKGWGMRPMLLVLGCLLTKH